jgi:hypothetical protein
MRLAGDALGAAGGFALGVAGNFALGAAAEDAAIDLRLRFVSARPGVKASSILRVL